MAKNFMTVDEYEFLKRIHEKKGVLRFATFSYAEVFGEQPEFKEICRIRHLIMNGMKNGFWTYSVERVGRKQVTYHFKPLMKIIKMEN